MLMLDPAVLAVLISFGLIVVLPIVVILTKHQRKMTELIHKNHQPVQNDELLARLDAMQRQMEQMQDRQNELLLQLHDRPHLHSPPPTPSVEERMQD